MPAVIWLVLFSCWAESIAQLLGCMPGVCFWAVPRVCSDECYYGSVSIPSRLNKKFLLGIPLFGVLWLVLICCERKVLAD